MIEAPRICAVLSRSRLVHLNIQLGPFVQLKERRPTTKAVGLRSNRATASAYGLMQMAPLGLLTG